MHDATETNRNAWAPMVEIGLQPGSDVEVETFFSAPDEVPATALSINLQARGWRTDVTTTKVGRLWSRRVLWAVVGHRAFDGVQPDDLEAVVADMESLAAALGGDFDGWGVSTSQDGPERALLAG